MNNISLGVAHGSDFRFGARTGGEHVQFAQRIIALINCGTMLTDLNKKIDMLEERLHNLEQKNFIVERHCATNYGTWAEELQAQWDACKKSWL